MVKNRTISSSPSSSQSYEDSDDSSEEEVFPNEIKVTKKKQKKRRKSYKRKGRKKKEIQEVKEIDEEDEEKEFVIDNSAFFSSIKEQIWTQDLFEEELFQKKIRRDLEIHSDKLETKDDDGEIQESEEKKLLTRLLIIEKKYAKNFKNPDFVSKVWPQGKGKFKKNLKQILTKNDQFNQDLGSYLSIDSGITVKPQTKYCDITGFQSRYTDRNSGLRFYSSSIIKESEKLSEEIKMQYLEMRKAIKFIS